MTQILGNLWLSIGTVFEQTEEYSKAIEAYKRAIDIDPSHVDAYYKLGDLYLTKLEDFKSALKTYTTAAFLDPIPIDAFISIGTTQDRLGANTDAMMAYKKAIELSSQIVINSKEDRRKIVWPRYKLGEVFIRLGDLDKAREIIKSALVNDIYLEWGDYSYWAMGRISMLENQPNQAVYYFTEALETSSYPYLRSKIYCDLAHVYISEEKFDQGINYLRKAKSEDPTNPNIYLYLADIMNQIGHTDDVTNEYKEYLKLWPNDESVKNLLAEIDQE